jgi:small subunit ribosomal protein S4
VQLKAKQKLRGYYGNISERQFRGIYQEARRLKGDTGAHMVGLLERRLDAIVYRAKFVPTVFAARQFINHGHVKVNGRRVNIASFQMKVGDVSRSRKRPGRWRWCSRRARSPSAMCRTTSRSTTAS